MRHILKTLLITLCLLPTFGEAMKQRVVPAYVKGAAQYRTHLEPATVKHYTNCRYKRGRERRTKHLIEVEFKKLNKQQANQYCQKLNNRITAENAFVLLAMLKKNTRSPMTTYWIDQDMTVQEFIKLVEEENKEYEA